MNHSFNVFLAQELGVTQAILLENIYFWVSKNEFNQKNIFDGRAWTYNSIKAFAAQFPYLTERQIRSALLKMEQDGVILTGNYNKSKYDRTKWYAISDVWKKRLSEMGYRFDNNEKLNCQDEKIHLTKCTNGKSENVEPIPYPNTYPNPDSTLPNGKEETSDGLAISGNEIVEKKEYGNPDINWLFRLWEEKVGFPIKTKVQMNRYACQRLIKSRSLDSIAKALPYVAMTMDDQYAPTIKNFMDLEEKWDTLGIYIESVLTSTQPA